jgi:tetratricopeptide (TPR) repeat protein
VLATSRELLKLRGEYELAVQPLASDREAITLFRERASAGSQAFHLGPDDLAVVEEICRRLDGVPLAIELAAPRLRVLTPTQLLERLREHLTLTGPRDAPARQQTLEAAINWSYELLDPDERRLFDQLGIFRGSFMLEAAESVCELDAGSDLLELLAHLLDKSMVHRVPDEGPRFAMLSMIRDFAHAHLEQTDELDATLSRLADFYLGLAPEADAGLRSVGQRRWRRLLDLEADNLRTVLTWLDERGRGPQMAVLLRALWVWFWLRGQLSEGREWLRRALAHERITPGDRGWLVGVDGAFAMLQGSYDVAQTDFTQARLLFAEAGDELGTAVVEMWGAILVAMLEGEAQGQKQAAASLATFEQLDDAWGVAMSLNVMAWLRTIFGRYEGAGDLFERALVASEQVGDELGTVMALSNLADAQFAAGEVAQAQQTAERGLRLLQTSNSSFVLHDLLETLATCSTARGEYEHAAELLGAASAARERMRVPDWGPALEQRQQMEATMRDTLGDELFSAAEERGRTRPIEVLAAQASDSRELDERSS